MYSQIVKVTKDKKSQRNCSRVKETKDLTSTHWAYPDDWDNRQNRVPALQQCYYPDSSGGVMIMQPSVLVLRNAH